MGCDQIHPTVLKLCADTLSIPFCKLFSDSLDQGVIPPEWKVHKICPILKIVNPGCLENFRPISLLCLTGKIIEKLIYNKIIDFVREKISIHQHGFLKGRSCLSQLISSYAYINDQLDKNCAIDVVYLDFKKAFDTVSHNELLYKLWRIRITGPLWFWFKNYLSGRLHYVSLRNVNSSVYVTGDISSATGQYFRSPTIPHLCK